MIKRIVPILVSAALVSGLLVALPASAQPTIPETVQITDPFSDANGLGGDQTTPADASTVADLGKIWFSNTADQISVHIQTELPRGAGTVSGNSYDVFTNPNAEGTKCLRFSAVFPGGSTAQGGTYQGPPLAKLLDRCKGDANFFQTGVEGQIVVDALADGTGLITLTFPRGHSPLLSPGGILKVPHAVSNLAVGHPAAGFVSRMIDNTVDGTDYALQDAGEGQPTPSPTASPTPPEEEKPKKCPPKKGKGKKKKKKCPKPPSGPPPCPVYTPGEQGAEAETSIVTDAATEDAPIEVEIDTELGLPDVDVTHVFHNIQVDSTAAETGLYARFDFDIYQDYDLYLNNPDGSEAAQAAGFNPIPVGPLNDTSGGGHSEMGAEAFDGIRTADCQGYTLDIASFLTEGGTYTLTLWLGEATYPA